MLARLKPANLALAACAVLLMGSALAGPNLIAPTASTTPQLPATWTETDSSGATIPGAIPINTVANTTTDPPVAQVPKYSVNNVLFADFAIANSGNAPQPAFNLDIVVDGTIVQSIPFPN